MPGLDAALAGVKTWIETNLLVDTVRIELPATGKPVLDEATGNLTRPRATSSTRARAPCRAAPPSPRSPPSPAPSRGCRRPAPGTG
jgi:hypothetical protein